MECRVKKTWLWLASILVALPAAVYAQRLSAPPAARVITVTPEPGWHAEPSIAIDPRNPLHVVVGYQGAGSVHSDDGGQTWSAPVDLSPKNYKVSGDVSVTFDTRGHVILCHIAFDKTGTEWYWGHNATRNGVYARRSLDGGKSWEPNPVPIIENATAPGVPFEDKPYLLADQSSSSRFSGNVYLGWTEYSLTKSVVLFSRSTDAGQTWSKPLRISTQAGVPRGHDGGAVGFSGTVGPDGTIYTVWSIGHHIGFTYSKDGGQSFAPSRFITDSPAPLFFLVHDGFGGGYPQIGIDPRPRHQRLYLTSSDWRNGDVDVFCWTSTDGGLSWTRPVRVNNDPIHNGKDQYLQWLAVDPVTGASNVIFFDYREDSDKVNVTLARSTDEGRTFQNYFWTSEPFDMFHESPGDYIGVAARDGHVYGAWAQSVAPADPAPDTAADGWFLTHTHQIVRVGIADFNQPR
jgi:photosystem II stability/assembly factor-like uncharacterized protein